MDLSESTGPSTKSARIEDKSDSRSSRMLMNIVEEVKRKKPKPKNYRFHYEWESEFLFTMSNGKCTCLICHATVAISKKSNLRRHFTTMHKQFIADYPENSSARAMKVVELKSIFPSSTLMDDNLAMRMSPTKSPTPSCTADCFNFYPQTEEKKKPKLRRGLKERKTNKATWTEENMAKALEAIKEGKKIRRVCRTFQIPAATVYGRLKTGDSSGPRMGRKTVFTKAQEKEIAVHAISLAQLFQGLTQDELRKLAFQYSKKFDIKCNFSEKDEMAGKDWVYGFLRRNPTVKLKKAESTAIRITDGTD